MQEALYIDNAFWQSAGTKELRDCMMRSAKAQGLRLIHRDNASFTGPDSFQGLPPAAIFWDKDLRLAQQLEMAGVKLFNAMDAIRLCDDKTLSYLSLKDSGIPQPETILCPQTFPGVGFTRLDFLDDVIERLGFPFVIKEGMGSFGQQVYLASGLDEAAEMLKNIHSPILFQRFVSESAGKDLRLFVVGGEVVASMMRVNRTGDFRANINHGGEALAHQATEEQERIAVQACRRLGLHFAGVDLLLGRNGPLLCEVNSNAHFKALRALTRVNPADAIVSLVKEHLS